MSLCSGQDSMAQDDIPLKPHQPANYKFPSENLKKKKRKQYTMPSNLIGLALGNGIPTWISKEHKNTNLARGADHQLRN